MDLVGFGYAALVTIGSILGYKRRGKPELSFASQGLSGASVVVLGLPEDLCTNKVKVPLLRLRSRFTEGRARPGRDL